VTVVTPEEAEEYKQFVNRYEQYWRTFFDPIAIRIQVSPEKYRFETIVLPLINNSIYTGLTTVLGGPTEPLDDLPVPDRNIFTLALKVNKPMLLKQLDGIEDEMTKEVMDGLGMSSKDVQLQVSRFLRDGLGSQMAMHVYDTMPTFDFNMTSFLGEMLGSFNGSGGFDDEIIFISLLVTSLNSPVYVSLPVKDAEIVDEFMEKIDTLMAILARQPAKGWFFQVDHDFYKMPLGKTGRKLRGYAIRFGPIKWRFFWARIDNGLYIASKPFIIDDLLKLHNDRNTANRRTVSKPSSPKAHAMVRVRARNWKQILPHFQLGWSENSRNAGLNNLSLLSNVARAYTVDTSKSQTNEKPTVDPSTEVLRRAEELYGCRFFCPEGGRYILSPDGKSMTSTAHGTVLNPLQSSTPSSKGPLGQALREFAGATAELSFLEDGLHAVLTIERK
jgi:hypothetical protein